MKRILFCCTAVVVMWPLAAPVAAEPALSRAVDVAARPLATGKLACSRGAKLGDPPDGLARQIHEINASIADLRLNNAAALRFRTIALAAYQRARAELTRSQVECGDAAGNQTVAALEGARR